MHKEIIKSEDLESRVYPVTSASAGLNSQHNYKIGYDQFSVTDYMRYGKGITYLQNLGKKPLDFIEIMQAILNQKNILDNNLWTLTGIAYKAGTNLIKIIPDCEYLKNIQKDFSREYITEFDFETLPYKSLDTRDLKCNKLLQKNEVQAHPVWLTLVNWNR